MLRKFVPVLILVVVVMALAVAPASAQEMTKIKFQLKWVAQAQFAGYYAAQGEGYYKDMGLDVTLLGNGDALVPAIVVGSGGAEMGTDWIGDVLSARENGNKVVHIAQIFQRSGMRELTWKDSGLTKLADLKGKTVGVWGFGNQFPLLAGLLINHIDPAKTSDVTIFNQPFDMNAFLNHEVDAAAAMTYNELAQVLEQKGEDGKFPLYTLDDLNVIDLNTEGSALLEDLIIANEDWLKDNEEAATKFLAATFKGWIFCRDNADKCVQYTMDAGAISPVGHNTWMMNEVNKLIWPSDNNIGIIDPEAYKQSVKVMLDTVKYTDSPLITAEPAEGAYRTDLAQAALDMITKADDKVDLMGKDWKPAEVAVTAGGE